MSVMKIILEQTATTAEIAMQKAGVSYSPATGNVFSIVSVLIHNNSSVSKWCKVKVGNTYLVGSVSIDGNATICLNDLNVYVAAGEYIYIQGETANDLQVRISGLEVN